ncbi:MAG TPA: type II secretion system protein [Oligoflexia bacterium]|nr:type II secretion system protein [Oligoflexia bacterium]HMP27670.1 type II secretion system protein [Oligoflexia bacterium]
MYRSISQNFGFTLIELLMVVIIIGILSATAYSNFMKFRISARNAVAISNVRNAATAQESYYATNEEYCPTILGLANFGYIVDPKIDIESRVSPTSLGQIYILSGIHKGARNGNRHNWSMSTGDYHCYAFNSLVSGAIVSMPKLTQRCADF